MTDLTRQEIIDAQLARQWAEWNKSCEVSSPEIQAAANFILAHTTPPTMADVEWDDELHYLAEATSDQFGRVIMLRKGKEGYIEFIVPGEPECGTLVAYTEYLTPTGRRYTLKEIDND